MINLDLRIKLSSFMQDIQPKPYVLLTRPQDDSDILCQILATYDLNIQIEPLITINPIKNISINFDQIQALIFTSKNAIKAFASLYSERHIPIFVVGEGSSNIAQSYNFTQIICGSNNALSLVPLLETLDYRNGKLLYLAGEMVAHDLITPLKLKKFEIEKIILYQALPLQELTPQTTMMIQSNFIHYIVFFSPRTAFIFVNLIKNDYKLVQACKNIFALCLSPEISKEIDLFSWKKILIASEANQNSLLSLFKLFDIKLNPNCN
ncbi:MAG: uroporphyrinogen-III synthase [Alphaproteobacteria bacterium]|nr:uroporphyrinogen-III synthase [Alphaproteobacteria bacterium]